MKFDFEAFANALEDYLSSAPQPRHDLPPNLGQGVLEEAHVASHLTPLLLKDLQADDRPEIFFVAFDSAYFGLDANGTWFGTLSELLTKWHAKIDMLALSPGLSPAVCQSLAHLTEIAERAGNGARFTVFEPIIGDLPPMVSRAFAKWQTHHFLWMDNPRMLWIEGDHPAESKVALNCQFFDREVAPRSIEWRLYEHSVAVVRNFLLEKTLTVCA